MNFLKIILIMNFVFFSLIASSFEESEFLIKMKERFESTPKCENGDLEWQIKTVAVPLTTHSTPSLNNPLGSKLSEPVGKYRLRYSIFGCELGKNGSIIIVPGRGEGSPEFYETALEFISRGFSPIYVMDPRGQGLSPRLIDLQKGHLENFHHYISDLAYVVEEAKNDLAQKGRSHQELYYLSNSMGAGIGLGHLMSESKSPFTAAAMLGPMIRINYLAFNKKQPTWLNNKIYSENGALAISTFHCAIGKCGEYADAKNFSDYKQNTRKFLPNNEDKMTHSQARYAFKTYLLDEFDWKSIKQTHYDSNENWESLIIGGATYGWVRTATHFLKHMKSEKGIKQLGNVPFNLIAGENDNRIYKPYLDGTHDLSRISGFCHHVNKLNAHNNASLCTLSVIKDGYHELLKESDELRIKAIDAATSFFLKHQKIKTYQSLNTASK